MSVKRCKVCGRILRNAESIAKGMGPTCERRVIGVVRGIDASRKRGISSDGPECVGLISEEDEDNG